MAVQTKPGGGRIVTGMQSDPSAHETAVEKFVDSVRAFSDNPGAGTLREYLEASIALEDARRAEPSAGPPLSLPAA